MIHYRIDQNSGHRITIPPCVCAVPRLLCPSPFLFLFLVPFMLGMFFSLLLPSLSLMFVPRVLSTSFLMSMASCELISYELSIALCCSAALLLCRLLSAVSTEPITTPTSVFPSSHLMPHASLVPHVSPMLVLPASCLFFLCFAA